MAYGLQGFSVQMAICTEVACPLAMEARFGRSERGGREQILLEGPPRPSLWLAQWAMGVGISLVIGGSWAIVQRDETGWATGLPVSQLVERALAQSTFATTATYA